MVIYVISFIISCFLLFKTNKIENKKTKKIICIISILIPCFLAGARKYTVGTDSIFYGKYFINYINNCDTLNEFLNYPAISNLEIGFLSLSYFIIKLTNSYNFMFFIIQCIISFSIYFGLKKYKNIEKYIWLAMFVFYTMFYNMGFNAIRQFLGISISFYGISCIINENKKINFFLSAFIAYLFHKSSILIFIIYILYVVLNHYYKHDVILKLKNKKFRLSKTIGLLALLFSMVVLYEIVALNKFDFILNSLGLSEYSRYVANTKMSSLSLIRILPIILLFILTGKKFILKNKDAWFYIIIFSLNYFIINQMSSNNAFSSRIGILLSFMNVVFFPSMIDSINVVKHKKIACTYLCIYLLIYWGLIYVINGHSETVPFVFFWN